MAAIRERAVAHFVFDGDPVPSTLDTTTLAWELLTHGVTRRVFKQAASSVYRRFIRPVFADETIDETEDKQSLSAQGLHESIYGCKLKVGEEEKEDEDEDKKEKERRGWWRRKEDPDEPKTVPELYVKIKIPRQNEILTERLAMAYSIFDDATGTDLVSFERVHVKWSTNVDRLKALYHEAQMYDRLRVDNANLTPKFYGFYEKYAGELAFGFSVFERSVRVINPEGKDEKMHIL